MNKMNSEELEAQLRTLAQAHKPDGAFAEQLEQRLMAAHVMAKPTLWARVLMRLGLTEAPSKDDLPQYDTRELKPKPNLSLASAVLLAVLVLAGGLVFARRGFQREPLGGPIEIATGTIGQVALTPTKQAATKPTVMPTRSATQTILTTSYIVVAGDTCSAIAIRFNVSLADLILMNKLDAQCNIQIGQRLAIPSSTQLPVQNLPPKPMGATIVVIATASVKPRPAIKLTDFHLSTTEAAPGERITATWSFEGAASKGAVLVPQPGETGEYLYSSSPVTRQTASLVFTVPALWGQTQDVQLSVNDAVIGTVQLTQITQLAQRLAKCNDAWFITPLPSVCPAGSITKTFAAVQVFEGGRMFWFQHSKTIVVLYEANGFSSGMQTFADNYAEGTPEADPSLIPPTGKQQPRRGFGWVWRTYPEVRQRLGWALQAEQGFNSCAQNAPPLFYFIDNTGYVIRLVGLEGSGYYQWDKVAPREGAPVNTQCSP